MNPEETYLQHLPTIKRIAAFVARRHHLQASEAEEFVQEVCVRLLQENYAIIRKFEGRSRFSTYLRTVIGRLFSQWRVEQWGKWRPSAEAKRLGEKAITLERLLSRDGYTFEEAVRDLTTGSSSYTKDELEAIYLRLPLRTPRPMEVSEENVPDVISVEPDAYERIEARERKREVRRALQILDNVIEGMKPEDQLILKLRYWHDQSVPEIAKVLSLDQKKLYKRFDRLLLVLRRELERAGVSRDVITGLLGSGDED